MYSSLLITNWSGLCQKRFRIKRFSSFSLLMITLMTAGSYSPFMFCVRILNDFKLSAGKVDGTFAKSVSDL